MHARAGSGVWPFPDLPSAERPQCSTLWFHFPTCLSRCDCGGGMRNAEPASWKVPCEKCPLRGKAVFRQFSETELEFVKEFKAGELSVEAGTTVLLEGTNSAHLYTVLFGWAFWYKMLPDGRRQILNFALPGDLVGVQGSMFDKMEHSVEALNDLTLCIFPREKVSTLFSRYPRLAFDVTWLCAARNGFSTRTSSALVVGPRLNERLICYCTCSDARRISG